MKNLQWLKNIKCVTLDWGDTLAHICGKDQTLYDVRRLCKLSQTFDKPIDLNTANKIIQNSFQKYESEFNSEKNNWIDCNKRDLLKPLLTAYTKKNETEWETFFDEFESMDYSILPLYHDLPKILDLFKNRGWKIGILSHVNSSEKVVRKSFLNYGLLNSIDFFCLSGDLKFTKPHPKHFEDAVIKSNCEPNQILHIGDHPLKDCKGANVAGFYNAIIAEPNFYPIDQVRNAPADIFLTSIFEMEKVFKEFECNPETTFYSQYPC